MSIKLEKKSYKGQIAALMMYLFKVFLTPMIFIYIFKNMYKNIHFHLTAITVESLKINTHTKKIMRSKLIR